GQTMVSTSGYSGYPYASSIPSVVNIINSKINNTATTNGGYAYLFNMNISATTICSRVPVRAINNCVTPVTWTSFYLVPQDNNSCKLVWSTANETNNSYFSIVRSSDGINFESIATVSGSDNRDISSNYFYVDTEPLSGTSYYYIIQYDFDGKNSSTAMKPYSSQGLIKVTTYPNPFQNNTTLLVSGPDAQTYTYTLYSVNGQLVEQGSGTINQIKTIGETLAKGMYMLTVLTSTDLITAKIVKQ
ncbi:MAG TPA: T9SS type A sorting domain-containing protein, partial [Cytophaga sp.]|nr:T9SS type A sorting domain-containing protein [Cytophaga sp.]